MSETVEAILTHTIKGRGPDGNPREINVDVGGNLAVGDPWETALIQIPGIGTAAAYASGDAFGTGFWVPCPPKGFIDALTFIDLDNEGIAKTIVLFDVAVTTSADNAAFTPIKADLLIRSRQINLSSSDYVTFASNQMATVTGIRLPYNAPDARGLWCRLVTRGADNIAAGAIPLISFAGTVR